MGKLLEKSIGFNLAYKILPQKGNLVYEYNPFRNYRLDRDLYEYDGQYLTLNKLNDLGITIQDLYEYNGQYLTLDELNNLGIAAQEKIKYRSGQGCLLINKNQFFMKLAKLQILLQTNSILIQSIQQILLLNLLMMIQ